MVKKILKWGGIGLGWLIGMAIITMVISSYLRVPLPPVVYGTSFDPGYAKFLGFDPQKVFQTIVGEWQFKYVRLPAHWEAVEPELGKFNFGGLDWFMDEAGKNDVKVMLALGQKTPRWPECHLPEWARELSRKDYENALLNYEKTVIERYKDHPALEIWQLENEPFLSFGDRCPSYSRKLLRREIAQLRAIDRGHQNLISDSGELSLWTRTSPATDLFGTTLYRRVWNPVFGYWSYDFLPIGHYRAKLWLNGRSLNTMFISELQAEPWIANGSILTNTIEEQYKSMSPAQLKKNINFANRLGVSRAYLWGAEWWYWLREQGKGEEILDHIKELKKSPAVNEAASINPFRILDEDPDWASQEPDELVDWTGVGVD